SGAECPAPSAALSDIQGAAAASPLLEQRVALTGVVSVADARVGSQRGFFLQGDEPQAAASSGIFVVHAGAMTPGERVHVVGRVVELSGVTALNALELLQPCGHARLRPRELELGSTADAERWEGTWLRSRQSWTLLDTSELWSQDRVRVSPQGRAYAPGHP